MILSRPIIFLCANHPLDWLYISVTLDCVSVAFNVVCWHYIDVIFSVAFALHCSMSLQSHLYLQCMHSTALVARVCPL